MGENQDQQIKSLTFNVLFSDGIENEYKNELGHWKVYSKRKADHPFHSGYITKIIDAKYKVVKLQFSFLNNNTRYAKELIQINEDSYFFSHQAAESNTSIFGHVSSINRAPHQYEIWNNSFTGSITVDYEEVEDTLEVGGALAHYKDLLESGRCSDVTIKTGAKERKEIKAHKLILMRSEFFDKMLNSDHAKEAQTGIIELEEEYDLIYELCRYLYYEKFDNKFAIDLLDIGDKYLIKNLVSECKQYLKDNISKENFIDVILCADKVNAESLKETVIDFIIKNCKYVFASSEWKELKEGHPQLAMLVMEKFIILNISKEPTEI